MTTKKKSLKELNLADDFLFAKVMLDMEICRKVLEKILNVPIRKVVSSTTQKAVDIQYESKGIRLDVYVNDDKGTVYNVEMQQGEKNELPKRTRYYQGTIDLDLISSGAKYKELKKTFIIFICTFDPFNEKRHIYTFQNRCDENLSLKLGDEVIKIFLNTKGKLDDIDNELKELLAYIENSTDEFAGQSSNELIKEIHRKVTEVKQSKKMEVEYMTLYMRDIENREEGREEGLAEGRTIGKMEGVIDAVRQLGGTMETAVQQLMILCSLSEEDATEKVRLYW